MNIYINSMTRCAYKLSREGKYYQLSVLVGRSFSKREKKYRRRKTEITSEGNKVLEILVNSCVRQQDNTRAHTEL